MTVTSYTTIMLPAISIIHIPAKTVPMEIIARDCADRGVAIYIKIKTFLIHACF